MKDRICKKCEHWIKRKAKLTSAEKYEQDTRPECKGFLNSLYYLWNPNYFRDEPPGFWEKSLDEAIIEDNKHLGFCLRFPKSFRTNDYHSCGEFRAVPLWKQDGKDYDVRLG